MPPSENKRVAYRQSAPPARSFPEWTQEDDSDIDIASIAEKQRVRFRAASVAGRQRYKTPLRELPAILTHRDISQEAHDIRAILQGRKLGQLTKGLEAATSSFANSASAAVGAVADGIGNSGSAAMSALAQGGGLSDAANAAAGSVSNGLDKGAKVAANAVSSAGGAFASALATSSESETSGNESATPTKTKDEPPVQTKEPPPPIETNDPPRVTEAPPPPPPPLSPPPSTNPPPPASSYKDPDPPKTTENPIDNLPPPKAEQPSKSDNPSDSESQTSSPRPSKTSAAASPTPVGDDQKLSFSTIAPGVILTTESSTRLLPTPVIPTPLPAITSGAKKETTPNNDGTTTPFAMAPGPTTMTTSIYTTPDPEYTARPSPGINPKRPDRDRDGGSGSRGGLSTGGQDALISIGVLVAVCAFFGIAYFFWRKGKKRIDSDHGGSFKAMAKPQIDRAKRGFDNVASRILYVRDRFYKKKSWENLDDPYGGQFTEKNFGPTSSASADQVSPTKETPRLEPITVQTTFTQRSSIASQFKNVAVGGTVSSLGVSTMGVSTMGVSTAGVSPTRDLTTSAPVMGRSAESGDAVTAPGANSNPLGQSPFADPDDTEATSIEKPLARSASQARQLVGTNHGPKPSLSSITPQYNLTLLSAMGGRRMSDLSSLSSGFGDGDIVVPAKQARKSTRASRLNNVTSSADLERSNRHSTATTVATNEGSARRDTVYTEASEDSPPRFRTVSSWVRQQSGRVKRAKQREQDAADESGTPPPVPAIPPEQEFRLMMPDGEEPRRVEDTNADWGAQAKSSVSATSGVIGAAR